MCKDKAVHIVEVTYEIKHICSDTFEVSEDEYVQIKEGELPERIISSLEYDIDNLRGTREDDWAATDAVTGVLIQDWL